MHTTQAQFRAALLDPTQPVPDGLFDGTGGPAGRRYAVYRNNVTTSLVDAMKVAFPSIRGLLGFRNFDTLVPIFVRQHPPRSALMMHYGADFPEFLESFGPLAHLGYLGDVARMDLAMRASYHAADAPPLDPAVLQQSPELLADLNLPRAPATRLLRSRWPLFDLWRRSRDADAPTPRPEAQAILITRPEYDPAPHLLPPGAATWLIALAHTPLGIAIEKTVETVPDFDLETCLTLALRTQAFTTPKDWT